MVHTSLRFAMRYNWRAIQGACHAAVAPSQKVLINSAHLHTVPPHARSQKGRASSPSHPEVSGIADTEGENQGVKICARAVENVNGASVSEVSGKAGALNTHNTLSGENNTFISLMMANTDRLHLRIAVKEATKPQILKFWSSFKWYSRANINRWLIHNYFILRYLPLFLSVEQNFC